MTEPPRDPGDRRDSDKSSDASMQIDAITQQIVDTREHIKVSEPSIAMRVQATADLNFAVGLLARVRSALHSNAEKDTKRRVG